MDKNNKQLSDEELKNVSAGSSNDAYYCINAGHNKQLCLSRGCVWEEIEFTGGDGICYDKPSI